MQATCPTGQFQNQASRAESPLQAAGLPHFDSFELQKPIGERLYLRRVSITVRITGISEFFSVREAAGGRLASS